MIHIKKEILQKVSEYNDATKLQFYTELLAWVDRQAGIVQQRMQTEYLEIVKDEPTEAIESTE